MDTRGLAGFLAGAFLAFACEAEPPPATWPQPGDPDPASAYPGASAAPGPASPATAQGCITIGDVKHTVESHWVELRRDCWEHDPSPKAEVDVVASFTIGPDGVVKESSATGNEPSVARCVQSTIRGWEFPTISCRQKVQIPFRFVRTGPQQTSDASAASL